MTALADPHVFHPLRLRVATAVHRPRLTRELAAGISPEASDELALRARQLTSTRHRRTLARTLRGLLTEAHEPMPIRARVVIIRRGAVLEAEGAILEVIHRLASPRPVRAQGMAAVERILTEAEQSPLYNRCEPGTLRRDVLVALRELEPDPSFGHEFPVGI
jgi:hypothetical protein